ncbi:hypothetical protein FVE67_02650 [Thermosulfurimonas marina]|uniref:PASTA domain-containing protein n=1 Tax=Thermosulfurimonas marina TaxID=2047767 RepID=A0A6H1WRE7_9BACT|nr:PASTA domain-containing protein [Thermosulfurimonas marina]QJA05763.1 hypothetical protein FVE67_02650 [Thermosulfurimonas marina]
MKKVWLLLGPIFFLILAGALMRPLTGAGKAEAPFLERTEVLDREGRVLFRMEKRARVYYLRSGPLPSRLKPYVHRPLSGPPPLLVAVDLSPKEARSLQGISGVLVEEYSRPRLLGGAAFEGILPELFHRADLEGRRTRLTLSWDLQESLYRAVRAEGLLGGAVLDLARGEVLALVPGRKGVFLHSLFRVRPSSGAGVFGRATGLELPEALGSYWPGGEALATPLQLARALAAHLCGRPPQWHLLRRTNPGVLVCPAPGKIHEKEYTYQEKGRWLRVKLIPEKAPRGALLLLGEGAPTAQVPRGLVAQLEDFWGEKRLMPEEEGFPDLRGVSLRAALEVLQPHGVEVEFRGFGRVIQQWPAPGTPWSRVKRCRLVLRDET